MAITHGDDELSLSFGDAVMKEKEKDAGLNRKSIDRMDTETKFKKYCYIILEHIKDLLFDNKLNTVLKSTYIYIDCDHCSTAKKLSIINNISDTSKPVFLTQIAFCLCSGNRKCGTTGGLHFIRRSSRGNTIRAREQQWCQDPLGPQADPSVSRSAMALVPHRVSRRLYDHK